MIKDEYEVLVKFNSQLTEQEKKAVSLYKMILQIDPQLYRDREMLRLATNHMLMAFVIGIRYANENKKKNVDKTLS